MFTKDLLGRYLAPGRPERFYHRAGKAASWIIMALMCLLAVFSKVSIWHLLEIKFEILVQIFPAFVLGVRGKRLGALPVLAGLLTGCAIAAGLFFAGFPKIWGFHAGLLGLLANFLVCLAVHLAQNVAKRPESTY